MSEDRFHRPEPQRTGPYRDFANILHGAGPRSDPDQGDPNQTCEPPAGFVAQGVRAAYEVVDAYLRQGQHVARALGLGSGHAETSVSIGAHHLLLRPVPGHPGVALHLVLSSGSGNLTLARMQLERIEPPQ